MRPQRETALGLPAPWGSGLPSLPLGSWWGEASAWDQCCSFLTAHQEDDDRERTTAGSWWAQAWALGPSLHRESQCWSHTYLVKCTPRTQAHTPSSCLVRGSLARTHIRPRPHTWSQSKSESYCCAGGWGVRGGYSTKSENSTITTMPMQSRSTCCRECHGSSSSKRSGSTFTRAM